MKSKFHNKNFAPSLAFIVRFKATRKWPIAMFVCQLYGISRSHVQRSPNVVVYGCCSFYGLYILYSLYSDPSVIEYSSVNQIIVEGDNVTLHCNATGNPAPNITWTKDGSPTVLYQEETYNIVNIQRQAAGDYTCTAWNGVGEKTNATATVTVHCESHFHCTPGILLVSVIICVDMPNFNLFPSKASPLVLPILAASLNLVVAYLALIPSLIKIIF